MAGKKQAFSQLEGGSALMEVKPPKAKWNRLLLLSAVASTLGTALPGGYCIGVINSPAVHMRAWIHVTMVDSYDMPLASAGLDMLWALIVSIFLIGGVLGSAGAGWASNRYGRRGCLLLSGLLLLLGAICFYFCRSLSSVELLLLGRLLVGLGSGLTTTNLPMYHSELGSISQRGTLGSCCALGFSIGLVLAQIFTLQSVFGSEEHWHIALSCYVLFMAVSYAPFHYYAESPKWLYIVKQRKDEARLMLQRLHGELSAADLDAELLAMEQELQLQRSARSLKDVLTDPRLRLPLLLICAYQGGQQLSGVNAIFYYSVSIFRQGGLSASTAEWMNLCAGNVNLAVAMLAPLLMAKYNRRTLMQLSSLGCCIFLLAFAFLLQYSATMVLLSYACMTSIFIYLIFFQLALGPMPSFIGAELFEVSSRSTALSVGNQVGWACNFLIGMIFPTLHSLCGSWTFLLFSVCCGLLFLLTKFYLPETRGRDISAVAQLMTHGFRSKVHE